MDVFFQSYTCLIYSKCSEQLSDFVLYCKLIHTREPWYQVSVRQARSLPKTSFRLHLAMNTLVVGWTLPAVRARWGLTPVRIRSCWANNKNGYLLFIDTRYLLNQRSCYSFPQRVIRNRCHYFYRLFGDRMNKLGFACMKTNPAILIGSFRTVL